MEYDVKIEKGVPIPPLAKKYDCRLPLEKMVIGDSIKIPVETDKDVKKIRWTIQQFKRSRCEGSRLGNWEEWKFVTRQVMENGERAVRIWRTR